MGVCMVKERSISDPAADAPSHEKKDPKMPSKAVKEGGIGRAQFILEKPGRIQDHYSMEKRKLGEGTYGAVTKGTHKATGAVRAIKTIAKTQMQNKHIERFKREIAIMKMMDHPSIIKLFETFEDQRNIYLAMELCTGGELFDRIIKSGHFTEANAATVMQQILRAVFYMHGHGICHRDLKPENFLFFDQDSIDKNVLKLIDFGLSCRFRDGDVMATKAGTPYYVAPQVLAGKYDQLCDVWSCGVVMFILLCGYPPFYGGNDAEVLAKVRQGVVKFETRDWRSVSEDAKDLIRGLLKMNPRDRNTAEQALNHSWIKHKAPRAANVSLHRGFVDNLRAFRSQNKLMKAALHIIAGQLSEKEIRRLRDTFQQLDTNSDGLLTHTELKEGLKRAGLKELPPDLQDLVAGVDADGSGMIDYSEFLAATLDKRHYLQEDVCWRAFEVFDLDGDGKITREELQQVLNNPSVEEVLGAKSIQELLGEVDTNGDGSIDFGEFMAMMRGSAPQVDNAEAQSCAPTQPPSTKAVGPALLLGRQWLGKQRR